MKIGQTHAAKALWILLGLVMLVPGLTKLFVMGPGAVSGMLSGIVLFAWAPTLWAWILIAAEIATGILILARWNMKYTTLVPIIILAVATLFMHLKLGDMASFIGSLGSVLQHLTLIAGYWLIGIIYSK